MCTDAGGSFQPYGVLAFLTALWLVVSAYAQAVAPTSAPLKALALAGTIALLLAVAALPLRYGRLRYCELQY